MTDRYLTRAAAATDDLPPNPLIPAALIAAVPVVVVLIGRALFTTIAIDNSTGRAVSYGAVRTAITQVLDKDLAADRVQEVLTDLPDAPPKPVEKPSEDPAQVGAKVKADAEAKPDGNAEGDAKAQAEAKAAAEAKAKAARAQADAKAREEAPTKRNTERGAKLKLVAARLNGERARLAERLTSLALQSHPGLDSSIPENLTAEARRQKMAEIVGRRLNEEKVRGDAETWVSDALDTRSRAAVESTVGATAPATAQQVAARAVAAALSVDALARSASAAVALPYNVFDTRPGESAWAPDVAARLSWAIIALLFILTFAIVAFTSVVQIWSIESRPRKIFLIVTAVAALIAGILTRAAFSPTAGSTPLHVAFHKYVEVFGVGGILLWADINNVLRGAGVVLLIAGSIATFWVKTGTVAELNVQLRGFKALFNAGAVFLLAGTFEVFAGFRWPIVFADEATRTALQGAASAFSATVGAGFAVVLLATYIATTAVLRQQAIAHGVTADEAATALQTFGFGDLTSQQFMRFAQALGPLVPGAFQLLLS